MNNGPKIVAFCGQLGSGKTTAANLLRERASLFSHRSTRFSFADRLKTVAADIWRPSAGFGEVESAFWGTQEDKALPRPWLGGKSGRQFLQDLGTLCREYNPDVWLNYLDLLSREYRGDLIVIDDLRYLNEAEAVKRLGGLIIGLRRADLPLNSDPHPSEQELVEHWSAMVAEEWVVGDLDDLASKVNTLWGSL